MNTYLGVSSLLCPADIDEATVAAGKVLYMEGYLYDRPEAKEAFRHAAAVAHAQRPAGVAHAQRLVLRRPSPRRLPLARHRRGRHPVRQRATSSLSLYEVESFDEAVRCVQRDCHLAVITVGAEGCYIITRDEVAHGARRAGRPGARHHRCRRPVRRRVPVRLHPRSAAGASARSSGAIAAAEVISHVGPRPLVELKTLIS